MTILLVELASSMAPNARIAASQTLLLGEGVSLKEDVVRLTAFTKHQLNLDGVRPWRRVSLLTQPQVVLVPFIRIGRGFFAGIAFMLQLFAYALLARKSLRGSVVYALNPVTAALGLPFARVVGAPLITRLQADLPRNKVGVLARAAQTIALRASAGVIAISDFTRNVALQAGVSSERVRVLPPALDPAFLALESGWIHGHQAEGRPFTVGYIGRLDSEKGPLDAVKAFADAESSDWRFIVAGRGPQEGQVRKQIRVSGIEDRTEWRGYVERIELPKLYAEIDVVVIPTLVEEGLGRVALEALLCGAVVVGYVSGGLHEACGQGGLLVPRADVRALAKALTKLAADPELLSATAAAGRAHALHATADATRMLSAVIDELLTSGGVRRSVA